MSLAATTGGQKFSVKNSEGAEVPLTIAGKERQGGAPPEGALSSLSRIVIKPAMQYTWLENLTRFHVMNGEVDGHWDFTVTGTVYFRDTRGALESISSDPTTISPPPEEWGDVGESLSSGQPGPGVGVRSASGYYYPPAPKFKWADYTWAGPSWSPGTAAPARRVHVRV